MFTFYENNKVRYQKTTMGFDRYTTVYDFIPPQRDF